MATLVAVYCGTTVGDLELVAASADPGLVKMVARRLLTEAEHDDDTAQGEPAVARREALRVITGSR